MALMAFMNRAAARRKSRRPPKAKDSGGVAFLPRPEQRDDGFGPDAIAPHEHLDDRIGEHFAKRQFAIDKVRARRLSHRERL